MRSIALLVALLVCIGVGAEPSMLERLQRELKVAAPPEHYPDHAEYRLFPKVCNKSTCFLVLAVQSPAFDGMAVHLAIFSESEHYLGSYAGLRLMPAGVSGPVLLFSTTAPMDAIRFDRPSPPPEIRVAGRSHVFQRAR